MTFRRRVPQALPAGAASAPAMPASRRSRRAADARTLARAVRPSSAGSQEWVKANPSRRPDIFPEFKPMKPALPQPMPGDPEVPDDEEEDEKNKKKKKARRLAAHAPPRQAAADERLRASADAARCAAWGAAGQGQAR